MSETIYETFIAMEPVAKGRPRVTSFGTFTPTKTKNAEARIQMQVAAEYKGAVLDEPLAVEIVFNFLKPSSKPKRKKSYMLSKPDLDNACKLIFDSLNGILWRDDSIIVRISATKKYSDPQGFSLSVRSVDEDEA